MRTSLWDIIRLAWTLWRMPYAIRKNMRIGQLLVVVNSLTATDMFYVENDWLLHDLRRYAK